ncbi:MAG: DUF2911 domain-containing protein [Bacteroidota bacterium]|nr:DUF2911 domain-containing protein [Bacteroidota bacterium]
MRISSVLFVCLLLLSCSDKKKENKVTTPVVNKEDSSAKPTPEKSINSYSPIDISPMDMSYFPADYPKLKMSTPSIKPAMARVVYSRPHLQGRQLFNDVLKYGEAWRLGANEATELDLYTDATIQGKKIKEGRYILYCIPDRDKWTIVLNSNIDSWGLHPNSLKDIAQFTVPAAMTSNAIEYFTMIFQPTATGADLLMAWDNVEVRLPLSF